MHLEIQKDLLHRHNKRLSKLSAQDRNIHLDRLHEGVLPLTVEGDITLQLLSHGVLPARLIPRIAVLLNSTAQQLDIRHDMCRTFYR